MYNVFKRPMFKRGGSTTGTGIMSHVEPRVMQQFGTGAEGLISQGMRNQLMNEAAKRAALQATTLPTTLQNLKNIRYGSFGAGIAAALSGPALLAYGNRPKTYGELKFIKETPPLTEAATREDYIQYEIARKEAAKSDPRPISFTDALFLDPETGTYPKFLGRTQDRPLRKNQEIKIADIDMRGDPAQFAGEDPYLFNALAKEEEAKNKAAIAKAQAAAEKDSKYSETDILSSVEDEKKILDRILPANVSTSEKAFLIAEALKGETLADKIDIAREEGKKIVKTKAARDLEKSLLAYRAATQKELAEIQAGKKGFTEKQFDKILAAQKVLSNPKSTEAQKERAREIISTISSTAKILSPSREGLTSADLTIAQNIDKLVSKIKRLEPGSDKYNKTLEEYAIARQVALSATPGLAKVIELADRQLGLENKKDGGRIGYALGSENPSVTRPEVGQVPTEPISKLSFEELRNRLPKEITDSVIRLIASSDEALQDFSYIRTQGDVVKFNQKYGVNLVLPAEA